jgi:hypothetical protein
MNFLVGLFKKLVYVVGGFVLLLIAISLFASSCSDSPTTSTSNEQEIQVKKEAPKPAKPKLEVLNVSSTNDGYVKYATGTIRNNTSRTYGYVQVEINLYDKSGAQVGSTIDNINNLEPGKDWKFKAVIFEDSATRFEIKDVTGF